jgi:starvation-inducible DNA-binding protein
MATVAKRSAKATTKPDNVDTGIEPNDRKEVAKALQHGLADTYSLYLKTLGVHWNIVGPSFYSVHKLTEEQYEDLHAAADVIAERVRALGEIAPASFGDYTKLSVVDSSKTPHEADAMIKGLISDNEAIAKRMRDFVEVAEEADDVFTADLLTARIGKHEENAWMLRALIS